MQFSSGQLRLQQVARIHGTFRTTCTDDIMDFIDKQDNPAFGFFHFIEHSLQTFLKLAPEFGARNQSSHIQCENGLVFQSLRHIAVENSLCQSFHHCSFTNPRLTDEHRIILRSSAQNLDGMTNLCVTADDRVQLSLSGHFHQIPAVLVQCVIVLFRVLAGDTLVASDLGQGFQECVGRDSVFGKDLCAGRSPLVQQCQIQMFHADILILELLCFLFRIQQQLIQTTGSIHVVCRSGYLRKFFQFFLQVTDHGRYIHIHVGQQLADESVLLLQQRHMQMLTFQNLMSLGNGDILAVHDSLLCILCIFFYIHKITPSLIPCLLFPYMDYHIPSAAKSKVHFSTLFIRVLIIYHPDTFFTEMTIKTPDICMTRNIRRLSYGGL